MKSVVNNLLVSPDTDNLNQRNVELYNSTTFTTSPKNDIFVFIPNAFNLFVNANACGDALPLGSKREL